MHAARFEFYMQQDYRKYLHVQLSKCYIYNFKIALDLDGWVCVRYRLTKKYWNFKYGGRGHLVLSIVFTKMSDRGAKWSTRTHHPPSYFVRKKILIIVWLPVLTHIVLTHTQHTFHGFRHYIYFVPAPSPPPRSEICFVKTNDICGWPAPKAWVGCLAPKGWVGCLAPKGWVPGGLFG